MTRRSGPATGKISGRRRRSKVEYIFYIGANLVFALNPRANTRFAP